MAALAVLLDFLLQVTAFVALIVFDFRRTENHRVDCFPCMKVSSAEGSNNGILVLMFWYYTAAFYFLSLLMFNSIVWTCGNAGIRTPGLLARYMKVSSVTFIYSDILT